MKYTKMIRTLTSSVSAALALVVSAQVGAVPLKAPSSLPLEGADLVAAKARLNNDDGELQAFATFIKGLDVYPDHQNPTALAEMSDHSKAKKFYMAPYFQAQEEDGVVGAQELSDEGIRLVAELQELTELFDLNLVRYRELTDSKKDKQKMLEDLMEEIVDHPGDENADYRASLQTMVDNLNGEIAELDNELRLMTATGAEGISETPATLRAEVINQLQMKLSFLGVTATSAEQSALSSGVPGQMVGAISTMVARASQGQFGVRQVVFKTGYSARETKFISIYQLVRPDVTVARLGATTVYARSSAMTVQENTPFAINRMVKGTRLFSAVNAGTNGRCGNTRACNATVDLTWLGSMMAATTKSGAVVIPVVFDADVSLMQPDFDGEVSCDFTTGWQVKGRADVKDGAIIYDGDVYNRINYASIEEGACNYAIYKGDKDSAAYHTITRIYDEYMRIKMQRAAKAKEEKDAYQQFVTRELQYHAARGQNTSYDFFGLSTWTSALGGVWGTVTSFVIGASRSFYWHTRIEDQSTTDAVKFTTRITETNVQATERFTFDGDPLVCWKGTGLSKYIGACPSAVEDEYAEDADHDVGANQNLCGEDGASAECLDEAADAEQDETTDENDVTDGWG